MKRPRDRPWKKTRPRKEQKFLRSERASENSQERGRNERRLMRRCEIPLAGCSRSRRVGAASAQSPDVYMASRDLEIAIAGRSLARSRAFTVGSSD